MYDTIIMGAGCAGLTAAIYLQRAGFQTLILERLFYGGQIALTSEIENYPGIERVTGPNLSAELYKQASALGCTLKYETITGLSLKSPVKTITTDQNLYEAKAFIAANGVDRRKLDIPGETALTGKGVSYCATCDGAFFKNQEVAVIGGGNTALEDALYLSKLCSKVYLIHRRGDFRGEKYLADRVLQTKNIEIKYHTVPIEILGTEKVGGLMLENRQTKEKTTLSVAGIFIAVGLIPDNRLFYGLLPMDQDGYFDISEPLITLLPGVYVAGDNRRKPLRQIVTAASDGAVAGYQAAHYLNAYGQNS